jgi:hypothetical protein
MGSSIWPTGAISVVKQGGRGVLAFVTVLLAAMLIGCGGGGGGGGTVNTSRSYLFTGGGQTVALTVDADNRFTIFAKDPAKIPSGAGGQGTLGTNGQFTAQGDDVTVQFSGSVPRDGSAATGTVTKSGANAVLFTAAPVTARGATPSGFAGSYQGTSGTTAAYLTVDTTSHATLYVNANGTTGGGLLNLDAGGVLTSADGSIAARLTPSGQSFTLAVTKLNGANVNISLTVNRSSRARWTFMVFLNGANDLQEFGPLNVNQMEKVGSTPDVNMVLQWKQANCATCGDPEWVGTRRYFIKKDSDTNNVSSQLLQEMGSGVDMGDWRTLRSFVTWAQQNYPADRYALVIWNHGAGWRNTRAGGGRTYTFPRSVSIDDENRTEIQTWDLPQALNVTPKLDLLIFDASLMQMAEVAYELRNTAAYMVGSEESPPGEGYVYDTFLRDLVSNPAITPRQFGTQVVNRTLEAYGNDNNLTQSNVELAKMDAVAASLSAFGASLQNHIADSRTVMQNARSNAQHYAYFDNKDLWDYAELIKTGTAAADLKTAATNVQNAIAAATVAEKHGTTNGKSHGMSIYVPSPTNYLSTYANLAIARATSWPQWLQNQP